jgi:hypothetical protein
MGAQLLLWVIWLIGLFAIVGLIWLTVEEQDEPGASAPPGRRAPS